MNHPPRLPASRRSQGFTLVELMSVVTIIGLMVGLAGPSMLNALAEARAQDLAGSVVNFYNGARARATGSGRAQLVRYTRASDTSPGNLVAYEGNNSSCNASDWDAIVALGCVAGGFCTDQLNPAARQLADEFFRLRVQTTGTAGTFAETAADMCFEPTGVTFWRAGTDVSSGAIMNASNGGAGGNLRGGFLFRIQRLDLSGDRLGPDRTLTAPLGAAARMAR